MMSTMRTTIALGAAPSSATPAQETKSTPKEKKKSRNPLASHFERRGRHEVYDVVGTLYDSKKDRIGSNSLSVYAYKPQGKKQGHYPQVALPCKPESPVAFYSLAMAFHHHRLEDVSSYLFAWTSLKKDSVEEQQFVVDLLIDAASVGYGKAYRALAKMHYNLEEKHPAIAKTILDFFKSRNFRRHVTKKDEEYKLEFWTQKKSPRTIAELEELARDIAEQGPIGRYYFLTFAEEAPNLVNKLCQLAQGLREEGSTWLNSQMASFEALAKEGQYEQVLKMSKDLLQLGKECYTSFVKIKNLEEQIQELVDLAKKQAPVPEEKSDEKPVLKKAKSNNTDSVEAATKQRTLQSKYAAVMPTPRARKTSIGNNSSTTFKPLKLMRRCTEGDEEYCSPTANISPTAALDGASSPSLDQENQIVGSNPIIMSFG